MRISGAALLLVASCGGAPPPSRADACLSYQRAVRGSLERLGRAADAFGDAVGGGPEAGARASDDFARAIDEERGKLASVKPARDDLAGAHRRMLDALSGLSGAMRFVGGVVARRDEPHREEARRRLSSAQADWGAAVDGVKRVCPEAALPP